MNRPWDDLLKRVFGACPQDFVSWLLPGARFLGKVSLELKTLTRTVITDTLYKVELNGQTVLLHVEFERRIKKGIEKRIWQYNFLATLEYDCPIYSFVIFLAPGAEFKEPPIVYRGITGDTIHYFHYWYFKLWEVPYQKLREPGLVGLLPLCVLAQGGKEFTVAEGVFAELRARKEDELLSLALSFASMVFIDPNEVSWLEKEIEKMEDIISDTWFYQRILQKGEAQGEIKGEIKGELKALRKALLTFIQDDFPAQVDLAQKQLNQIQDAILLLSLHKLIVHAKSPEEVERYLREAVKQSA